MEKSTDRFPFIDSVRAIAIFLVIFVHTAQKFSNLSAIKYFAYWSQMGVQLFFLASAFTLCLSLERAREKDEPIGYFFIRRYFRIAPGYYFGILFYLLVNIITLGINSSPKIMPSYFVPMNILPNVFLLQGFFLQTSDAMVPGGWSVGTEFVFYLLLPILYKIYLIAENHHLKLHFWAPILALILSFSVEYLVFLLTGYHVENNNLLYLSIINQFPIFVIGLALYHAYKVRLLQKLNTWLCLGISFLFVSASVYMQYLNSSFPFYYLFVPFVSSIGFAFLFIALMNQKFSNPFFVKMGVVSYSCYIIHFVFADNIASFIIPKIKGINSDLLLFISFLLISLLTYGTASLIYRFIEKPGILFGKRLIDKIKERDRSYAET